MTLAEKIMRLRRQRGWSQEELAERLGVSRQAVSKWEGAQSVPEPEKIVQLSDLFGVTTDYLLRDSVVDDGPPPPPAAAKTPRQVTPEQAAAYLALRTRASRLIALGVLLCALAPLPWMVALLPSRGAVVYESAGQSPAAWGLPILLALDAAAAALFLCCARKSRPYAFLKKEPFALSPDGEAMARDRRQHCQSAWKKARIIGLGLCALALLPFFLSFFLDGYGACAAALCAMQALIGLGAALLAAVWVRQSSADTLLHERAAGRKKRLAAIYWLAMEDVILLPAAWLGTPVLILVSLYRAAAIFLVLAVLLALFDKKKKSD